MRNRNARSIPRAFSSFYWNSCALSFGAPPKKNLLHLQKKKKKVRRLRVYLTGLGSKQNDAAPLYWATITQRNTEHSAQKTHLPKNTRHSNLTTEALKGELYARILHSLQAMKGWGPLSTKRINSLVYADNDKPLPWQYIAAYPTVKTSSYTPDCWRPSALKLFEISYDERTHQKRSQAFYELEKLLTPL